MLYAILKMLHWAAVIVWLGGMVFAHFCLRPAAASLPPPVRVPLMAQALGRFLNLVLVAALTVLVSGGVMLSFVARATRETGAAFNMPLDWMFMAVVGLVMVAVYGHIRMALFRRLQRAVAAQDWPAGGAALNEIRFWVGANLSLGALIVVVVALGAAT